MLENNLKNQLKKDNQERNAILKIQKDFENGNITENELTEEQKAQLEKMYDEQIEELDRKIKDKKMELNSKIKKVNNCYQKLIDLKMKSKK